MTKKKDINFIYLSESNICLAENWLKIKVHLMYGCKCKREHGRPSQPF